MGRLRPDRHRSPPGAGSLVRLARPDEAMQCRPTEEVSYQQAWTEPVRCGGRSPVPAIPAPDARRSARASFGLTTSPAPCQFSAKDFVILGRIANGNIEGGGPVLIGFLGGGQTG
jgi:hypothetical protein